jgi:hypothetical protein
MKKSGCVLWASASYRPGNTVIIHYFMSVGMSVNHTKTILDVLLNEQFDENCTLLGYYVAGSGSFLPKFQDNLSVPFSGFKNPKKPAIPVQSLYREKCGQ